MGNIVTMTIINNVGLLCLIIDGKNDDNHKIKSRTKMQKISYFCQYFDWGIRDYKLHNYGPFSITFTQTVESAEFVGLIKQSGDKIHTFTLTDKGLKLLDNFKNNIGDPKNIEKTKSLIRYLYDYETKELEIISTIDFVQRNNPISKDEIIDTVAEVKCYFNRKRIQNSYNLWLTLKNKYKFRY